MCIRFARVRTLLTGLQIYYNAKFHTAEKEAKYIRLANDFYWKVLQKNPANIYAANGMGIVVAEKGEISLAKEFFTQVSEASETMPDVRLNLAHIHFAQGMFINAVKLVIFSLTLHSPPSLRDQAFGSRYHYQY